MAADDPTTRIIHKLDPTLHCKRRIKFCGVASITDLGMLDGWHCCQPSLFLGLMCGLALHPVVGNKMELCPHLPRPSSVANMLHRSTASHDPLIPRVFDISMFVRKPFSDTITKVWCNYWSRLIDILNRFRVCLTKLLVDSQFWLSLSTLEMLSRISYNWFGVIMLVNIFLIISFF